MIYKILTGIVGRRSFLLSSNKQEALLYSYLLLRRLQLPELRDSVLLTLVKRHCVSSFAYFVYPVHESQSQVPSTSEETLKTTIDSRSIFVKKLEMNFFHHMQYPIKHDATKEEVEIQHPGLSYESIDSDGNPKIWSLLNLLVSGRFIAYQSKIDTLKGSFLEYNKMTSDRFTFMVATELAVGEAMYQPKISKNPMRFRLQLGYVGNTSLNTVATVLDSTGEHHLMSNTNQVVCVDKVTRRPMPLPDWWRERFAWAATRSDPLRSIPFPIPENPPPATYRVTVGWSDTDLYKHTNFSSYVRFSVDAIHDAVSRQALGSITDSILCCGIKYIRMSYTGESVTGDELEVRVWEKDGSSPTVCCDIHKVNDPSGKSIFQCTITYYEPPKSDS